MMNPVVDSDSKILYFSSNVEGGFGGYDLYAVTYDENWVFGEATNLGPAVNSAGNERDPYFGDGYLYFSTDGRSGFGGMDVFRVKLEGSDPIGLAENLGAPINTVADDFGFQLAGDKQAYLSSDRSEGSGYDDFYKVEWKDKKVKFEARSTDQGTDRKLTEVKVELVEGGVSKLVSLEELAVLLAGSGELEVKLSHPGHFRTTQKLVLDDDQDLISLNLVAIPYELDVYEAIIYYDLDKDLLRDLSREKLDEIKGLMMRHPELSLDIASHTDSRASLKYNEKLSERRARSVTKYLDDRGVERNRVSAAWFSETRLLNDCGDGVKCPEEIHERNRRSELTLSVFPDRSKEYELPAGASASDFATPEAVRKWFSQK
jgi:outer membrane protein OmpA-like peptidoglycan-associated protein